MNIINRHVTTLILRQLSHLLMLKTIIFSIVKEGRSKQRSSRETLSNLVPGSKIIKNHPSYMLFF